MIINVEKATDDRLKQRLAYAGRSPYDWYPYTAHKIWYVRHT